MSWIGIWENGNPDYSGIGTGSYGRMMMDHVDRRRSVEQPNLAVVELNSVLGESSVGGEGDDSMNRRDGKGGGGGDGAGEKRASSDEEEPEIGGREVKSNAEIAEGRHNVAPLRIRVGFLGGGDDEVRIEDLVGENRVGEMRRVREGQRGRRRLDEERMGGKWA